MRIPSRFAFRRNTQVSWAVQVFLTEACGHTLASLSPVMRSQWVEIFRLSPSLEVGNTTDKLLNLPVSSFSWLGKRQSEQRWAYALNSLLFSTVVRAAMVDCGELYSVLSLVSTTIESYKSESEIRRRGSSLTLTEMSTLKRITHQCRVAEVNLFREETLLAGHYHSAIENRERYGVFSSGLPLMTEHQFDSLWLYLDELDRQPRFLENTMAYRALYWLPSPTLCGRQDAEEYVFALFSSLHPTDPDTWTKLDQLLDPAKKDFAEAKTYTDRVAVLESFARSLVAFIIVRDHCRASSVSIDRRRDAFLGVMETVQSTRATFLSALVELCQGLSDQEMREYFRSWTWSTTARATKLLTEDKIFVTRALIKEYFRDRHLAMSTFSSTDYWIGKELLPNCLLVAETIDKLLPSQLVSSLMGQTGLLRGGSGSDYLTEALRRGECEKDNLALITVYAHLVEKMSRSVLQSNRLVDSPGAPGGRWLDDGRLTQVLRVAPVYASTPAVRLDQLSRIAGRYFLDFVTPYHSIREETAPGGTETAVADEVPLTAVPTRRRALDQSTGHFFTVPALTLILGSATFLLVTMVGAVGKSLTYVLHPAILLVVLMIARATIFDSLILLLAGTASCYWVTSPRGKPMMLPSVYPTTKR